MRKKHLLLGVGLFFIILVGLFIVLCKYFFEPSITEEFLEMLSSETQLSLTAEELSDYRQKIEAELVMVDRRSSFQQIYYSLGVVASLENKYSEANNYFRNALDANEYGNESINVNSYKGLAMNSIYLGQFEEGYAYFEQANERVAKLNDNQLKASLYGEMARALIDKTDHLHLALYLLDQTVDLVEDSHHQVQTNLLLSKVYQTAGLYDLALNQSIKSLEIARLNGYQMCERSALSQMGELYFLTRQYQAAVNVLNAYLSTEITNDTVLYSIIYCESLYYAKGYDSAVETIEQFEIEFKKSASQIEDKQLIIDLLYATVLYNEGRYDEAQQYLQKNTLTESYDVIQLWQDKLKLDIQRAQQIDLDYVEAYRELIRRIETMPKIGSLCYSLLDSMVDTLIDLKDFETIYIYTSLRTKPVQEELGGLAKLSANILPETAIQAKQRDLTMVVPVIGCLVSLLIGGGVGYGIFHYSRQLKLLKQTIVTSKGIDPLTQTLTKAALYNELETAIGYEKESRFLLIEVDNFSAYNELFGYLAGDKVLKGLSELLREYFPNDYISRHYGVQFIIVTSMDEEELLETMTEMIQEVEQRQEISKNREMTLSIGVSSGHLNTMLDIDQQIKLASNKLRISKQRGNGICTF